MKLKNLHGGILMFNLREGEQAMPGETYQIVDGGFAEICYGNITTEIYGVCMGGGNVEKGKIMLDIDPTSVFEAKYEDVAPSVGYFTMGHRLVLAVDETARTYEYLVRKATTV